MRMMSPLTVEGKPLDVAARLAELTGFVYVDPGTRPSALGATYAWRDAGLENGVRYYYRMEDVDTASVSTFHGPVSAVPELGLRRLLLVKVGARARAADLDLARGAVLVLALRARRGF